MDSATVLSSINPGQLRFSLTSEPTSTDIEGLTLHVCDAAFAFADAGSGIGGHTYNWASSLDWSSDTSRTLYLSVPSDTTAPSPASAEVPSDGGQVDVVFDEDLVRPTMAVAGAFTLTADGVELDVENLSGGADTLIFNLAFGTKIYAGQIVRLSYDKTLAGADALEDAAGNEVASFTDFPVTNNSGADNTETVETHPNGTPRLVIDDKGTLSTTGEGRLEVFFKRQGKGEWGTVCDDRFDREFFDYSIETEGVPGESNAPKVANIAGARACQLLGHDTGEMVARSSIPGMTPLPNVSRGDPNFRPIWLDDVRCSEATHGTVSGLQHCYHAGVGLHNCGTQNKPDHKRGRAPEVHPGRHNNQSGAHRGIRCRCPSPSTAARSSASGSSSASRWSTSSDRIWSMAPSC